MQHPNPCQNKQGWNLCLNQKLKNDFVFSQSKLGHMLAPVVRALDVVAETSGYANVAEMSAAISSTSQEQDEVKTNLILRKNSKTRTLVR